MPRARKSFNINSMASSLGILGDRRRRRVSPTREGLHWGSKKCDMAPTRSMKYCRVIDA